MVIRRNGFTLPLNPYQMLSWFLFALSVVFSEFVFSPVLENEVKVFFK